MPGTARTRVGTDAIPGIHLWVLGLFMLSGATGLVYQIVWMRRLVLVFGATALAVSTVLTVFMGGLGLGAWLLGRRVDRSADPLRVYGLLEIAIGVYAAALPWLLDALAPIYRSLWLSYEPGLMVFALLKFVGTAAVLLLPTTLMGATLPVLSRWAVRRADHVGTRTGALYAVNTFGAVAGTLACGFVMIRYAGVHNTNLIAAALNVAIGLSSLALARRQRNRPETPAPDAPAAGGRHRSSFARRAVLVAFGLSGCAALLLEVAWTRVLTLIIGGSVYAFALMLAAFLAGLALGAAAMARLADADRVDPALLLCGVLAGAGVTSAASLWLFDLLPWFFARFFLHVVDSSSALALLNIGLCAAVMLPTTFLLGGVFPVAIRLVQTGVAATGRAVGNAYAANAAGTIAGAFAGGFVAIPLLGLSGTVAAAAVVELAVAAGVCLLVWQVRLRLRAGLALALVVPAVAVALVRPGWNTLLMNSGPFLYAVDLSDGFDRETFREFTEKAYRELYYREGLTATVLVGEEQANGNVFLSVNGKVDASSGSDMQTQVLSGQLPLLLHGSAPADVLVVGLASGVTAGSVLTHPVSTLDVVEIEQAVVEASRYFDRFSQAPLDDPRTRPVVNDGRNYLLFTDRSYDVIISEPSNPWLTGAANLFTLEYFKMVSRRLRPGGIACQWIQAYNMRLGDLKSLLRTFAEVYPHVRLFDLDGADLLLLGSDEPLPLDPDDLGERMALLDVALDLSRIGIRGPGDLLTWFAFGERELRRLVGDEELNTDDGARVEFSAPWALFEETAEGNGQALAGASTDPELYFERALGPANARDLHLSMAVSFFRRGEDIRALRRVDRALDLGAGTDVESLRRVILSRLER